MKYLQVLAGPSAYQHIRQHGLDVEDISAVFGASGAAKWLGIYGLDRAILSDWLTSRSRPLPLFGTSVGAWKLAAGAQADSAAGLQALATAYIEQSYAKNATQLDVVVETQKIIDQFLGPGKIDQILNHPIYRYSCGAVRCKGLLAYDNKPALAGGMLAAMLYSSLPFKSTANLSALFDRAVFSDSRLTQKTVQLANSTQKHSKANSVTQINVDLNADNFLSAIRASGGIPYIFPGVNQIAGAPAGTYRDGGLLDYHPIPNHIIAGGTSMNPNSVPNSGLVLYPHFYDHIIPTWFDKFHSKRRATAAQLGNVILLAPTPEFIAMLPGGRLPDRHDFKTYRGDNALRQERWYQAMALSDLLGQEFLAMMSSNDIAKQVRPL